MLLFCVLCMYWYCIKFKRKVEMKSSFECSFLFHLPFVGFFSLRSMKCAVLLRSFLFSLIFYIILHLIRVTQKKMGHRKWYMRRMMWRVCVCKIVSGLILSDRSNWFRNLLTISLWKSIRPWCFNRKIGALEVVKDKI